MRVCPTCCAGSPTGARCGLPAGLKAPQEKFPDGAIRDAGYGVIWHGQKSWNGVAILPAAASRSETAAPSRAIQTTLTAAT